MFSSFIQFDGIYSTLNSFPLQWVSIICSKQSLIHWLTSKCVHFSTLKWYFMPLSEFKKPVKINKTGQYSALHYIAFINSSTLHSIHKWFQYRKPQKRTPTVTSFCIRRCLLWTIEMLHMSTHETGVMITWKFHTICKLLNAVM